MHRHKLQYSALTRRTCVILRIQARHGNGSGALNAHLTRTRGTSILISLTGFHGFAYICF
jgi:hypothetical protein